MRELATVGVHKAHGNIETIETTSCKASLRMQSPTSISDKSFTTQPNPTQPSLTQPSTAHRNTAQTYANARRDTDTHAHADTEKERQTDTHRQTHTNTQRKARHQAASCGRCAYLRCALSGVCRSPYQQERSWGCCAGAPPGCRPALPHQARALPPCVTSALALLGLDPAPAAQQTRQ